LQVIRNDIDINRGLKPEQENRILILTERAEPNCCSNLTTSTRGGSLYLTVVTIRTLLVITR
jgi:hypothetical protein